MIGSAQRDHPAVAHFWEMFDYLDGIAVDAGHERLHLHPHPDQVIAVNLVQFEQTVARYKLTMPVGMHEMRQLLPFSRHRPYIKRGTVCLPNGRGRQAWFFLPPKREEEQ